jgi:hypothetical protein
MRFRTDTVSSFASNMLRDRRRKCNQDGNPSTVVRSRASRGVMKGRGRFSSELIAISASPAAASALIPRSPSVLPRFAATAESRDLVLLAPLTAVHLSRTAIKYVSANISQFILSPDEERSSYVFHVPYRSGHDDALDRAVECVIAAFHGLYLSDASRYLSVLVPLSLYTRALISLQHALDDPKRSHSAETLCATQLLCIFEVSKHNRSGWPMLPCHPILEDLGTSD